MTATQPLLHSRIGFIGTGVMAEAMLSGLLDKQLIDAGHVVCSHPRADRRDHLHVMYNVSVTHSNADAAAGAALVVLAVKPQMLGDVMRELRGSLSQGTLVLSVIAGATTHTLSTGLQHQAIVRCMPNTPAQIGQGVTVWYATDAVTHDGKALVQHALSALGREFEVHDERQVAMATAVSGTGPTYIFLFIEALTDAAVRLGFPRHVARELVLDTMQGAAAFALHSGKHVAELRDMVTSPGGTSAGALYELEKGRLRTVVADAVQAAFERTQQLESVLEDGVTLKHHRVPPDSAAPPPTPPENASSR